MEQSVGACQIVQSNLDACKQMCERVFFAQCNGVMVVPAFSPPNSLFNVTDLIPWDAGDAENKCRRSMLDHAKPGDFICVPVRAFPQTETRQNILVTKDMMAPEFYSTCHVRQEVRDEPPAPVSSTVAVDLIAAAAAAARTGVALPRRLLVVQTSGHGATRRSRVGRLGAERARTLRQLRQRAGASQLAQAAVRLRVV